MTRRKPNVDQRSPKSETMSSRERDRFGNGMGKKSSSTSQLSATGMFILFRFAYVVIIIFYSFVIIAKSVILLNVECSLPNNLMNDTIL